MAFLRRHWPVLLVVLFPLLPLWRAVFLGEAIGPFDQIRQMAPWNAPAPDRPFDVLQADAVLQFYPWRDMVFEAWGKGQLPLWNPYQLAGTPLLANSQSAGFYPPHILMGVFQVPTHWAMTLLAWFHLAWAGLGVMALARRLGASREGGAIGGVLFSGSAFMLAWTALPSVISTCAWIPWVLAGVYGLFSAGVGEGRNEGRGTKNEGSSDRSTAIPQYRNTATPQYFNTSRPQYFKSASGLAFATAMMLLAGHLQFAFYGLLAGGFVWLCLTLSCLFDKTYNSYKTYSILLPLVALALGAGMAAPQLLPVMEYSQFSHRRNTPSEEGYKAYTAGAIAPFELVGLVYPTAVGLPYEFAPEHKPLSQYWPALVKQGANFAEGAIGIGPLALFGLLMFPWRSHAKRLWVPLAVLAGIAFLMALGTVLNKPFYFLIPGWSSTGSPGRIGVLFVMGVCVLAALGISQGLAHEIQHQRLRVTSLSFVVSAALTMTILYWLAPGFAPRFEAMPKETVAKLILHSASFLVLPILLGLMIAMAAFAKPRNSTLAAAQSSIVTTAIALGALLFMVPSLIYALPTSTPITPSSAELTFASTLGNRIAAINEPWELVVAAPAVLPPNAGALLRMPDLAGYDSLLHKDTHLFLGYVNGQDPAPPANGNIQYVKPTARPEKLEDAGVSTVYARRPLDWPGRVPVELGNGLFRYDLAASGRCFIETAKGGTGATLTDGYDRQHIVAAGPGLLVVKDRLMPGWSAWVDGKPVPWSEMSPVWKAPDGREVRLWRAVDLAAAREYQVEFRYDPPGLKTGLLIFAPCFVLALGGLGFAWFRRIGVDATAFGRPSES